jgi:hypothetical protein
MTNAERQAAYRARKSETGSGRMTTMVSPVVPDILRRMAAHTGMTHADLVERAMQEAESRLMEGMSPAERKKYHAK